MNKTMKGNKKWPIVGLTALLGALLAVADIVPAAAPLRDALLVAAQAVGAGAK